MKKISLAMITLALAMVFGLAFVGCGGDTGTPKTIEGLFDELKDLNVVSIYAYNGTTYIDWCTDQKRWEGTQSHEDPPAFALADAIYITGSNYWTQENYGAALGRNVIKKLNGFFDEGSKTGGTSTITWNSNPADGTSVQVWYYYYLNRNNGRGVYGASPTPTVFPTVADEYQF